MTNPDSPALLLVKQDVMDQPDADTRQDRRYMRQCVPGRMLAINNQHGPGITACGDPKGVYRPGTGRGNR